MAIARKEHVMGQTTQRLLLVAADPTLRFTLEDLLRYYGYMVTTVATMEAAAQQLADHSFDLLLQVGPPATERLSVRSLSEPALDTQTEELAGIPT
jgi:hypothetical protein